MLFTFTNLTHYTFSIKIEEIERLSNECVAVLYTGHRTPPPLVSISIVYKEMEGVAHCSGTSTQKIIALAHSHFSPLKGQTLISEICGVLVHELTHAWQYASDCPGGLIEGIADYVRLKCGYIPSHWRSIPGKDATWDSGYQTTAYFLEWIELHFEKNICVYINADTEFGFRENLFKTLTGLDVDELWLNYVHSAIELNETSGEVEDYDGDDQ